MRQRDEKQVLAEILDFARLEKNIRVVIMNGSRVNPNAPRDKYQDYDVVFFAENVQPYLDDRRWIHRFGELVITQQNSLENDGWPGNHIFMMQYKDGVRLDLTLCPLEQLADKIGADSLTRLLLDKDGRVAETAPPDERSYYVARPARQEYDELLNELWWVQPYVAKGICRDEYSYARACFDNYLREALIKLLSWYICCERGWNTNPGKSGKWFKRCLPPDIYQEFLDSYPGKSYAEMREALAAFGRLVRKTGMAVAEKLGYQYPLQDDVNVTEFLEQMLEERP